MLSFSSAFKLISRRRENFRIISESYSEQWGFVHDWFVHKHSK